jgi:hypothetical protein
LLFGKIKEQLKKKQHKNQTMIYILLNNNPISKLEKVIKKFYMKKSINYMMLKTKI